MTLYIYIKYITFCGYSVKSSNISISKLMVSSIGMYHKQFIKHKKIFTQTQLNDQTVLF